MKESDDPIVTVAGPPGNRDTTLFTEAGPIRLIEGRARVRLSTARKLVRGGWTIEPDVTLENTKKRSTTR